MVEHMATQLTHRARAFSVTFKAQRRVRLREALSGCAQGKGYQRPFELATLRLLNMATVLGNWEALSPADSDMLVQRGGVLVFDGGRRAPRAA